MRGRAFRRHRAEVRRQQVVRLVRDVWRSSEADNQEFIARNTSTRTRCSCLMCGNPRRLYGQVTLAERRIQEVPDAT